MGGMPPTIRYATTTDEVRIAFAMLGPEQPPSEGGSAPLPILTLPPLPFSHVEAGWELAGQRRWYERLARHTVLATYDSRGTGLSERPAAPVFALDEMLRDLDAVVDRLHWERLVLCGLFNSAPVAITYAARHPERVPCLVLWGGFARGVDAYPMAVPPPAGGAVDVYWPLLVDMAARTWTADSTEAADVAAFFQQCVSPDTAVRAFLAARDYDVSASLPSLRARTLVLHRPRARGQRADLAPTLAASIPNGELVPLDGVAASPFTGDPEPGIAAIERFLGIDTESGIDRVADDAGGEELTPRELEVLRLVARGLANKEIAGELGLSIHTIERHLTNLYPKIGCRSRTEATAFALTHGLG